MKINTSRLAAALYLVVVASVSPVAAAPDLVIIAHPGLAESALESKELQRIYLGKLTQWHDDSTIVPVMLKTGPVHEEFIEDYIERSVQRFVTYWRQMVFTGKGVPPKSFGSESELVAFVARTPGSVGFASAGANVSGVKVLPLN